MFWVVIFAVVVLVGSAGFVWFRDGGPRSDYPSPSVYRFPVVRPWWK